MNFAKDFLEESVTVISSLDADSVEQVAEGLANVRNRGGRLFILGVGGSAGHASHAVNDFRKICGFEAYTPTDNVSELTARANDEGWDTTFAEWLKGAPARPDVTGGRSSPSAGATPSGTCRPTSSPLCSWPRSAAPRSTASSDATAGRPPSWRMRAS